MHTQYRPIIKLISAITLAAFLATQAAPSYAQPEKMGILLQKTIDLCGAYLQFGRFIGENVSGGVCLFQTTRLRTKELLLAMLGSRAYHSSFKSFLGHIQTPNINESIIAKINEIFQGAVAFINPSERKKPITKAWNRFIIALDIKRRRLFVQNMFPSSIVNNLTYSKNIVKEFFHQTDNFQVVCGDNEGFLSAIAIPQSSHIRQEQLANSAGTEANLASALGGQARQSEAASATTGIANADGADGKKETQAESVTESDKQIKAKPPERIEFLLGQGLVQGEPSSGMNRRQFLKNVGIATAGLTLASAGLGTWAYYAYATDKSSDWEPYDYVFANTTVIRDVWVPTRPNRDFVTQLSKFTLDRQDIEIIRKTARDLRLLIAGVIHTGESDRVDSSEYIEQRMLRSARDYFSHIVDLVHELNAYHCKNFATQWEVITLRNILIDLLFKYAEEPYFKSEHAQSLVDLCQSLTDIGSESVDNDPFVTYFLSEAKIPIDDRSCSDYLNDEAHHLEHINIYYSFNPEAWSKLHPVLRKGIRQLSFTYRYRFNSSGLTKEREENLSDLSYALEARSRLYPTQAAFEEACNFYKTLKEGPVRCIDINNIEPVKYVRQRLMQYREYFVDSGQYHDVAPDVLAAIALANLLFNAYTPSYSLGGGMHTAEATTKGGFLRSFAKQVLRITPGFIKDINLQDRASDWLGALVDASPTIGIMQSVRAGPTGPGGEYNVREQRLLARWFPDSQIAVLSNRQLNKILLNPKHNIEAAAALYEQGMRHCIVVQRRETDNKLLPDLNALKHTGWLNTVYHPVQSCIGPDTLLITAAVHEVSFSGLSFNHMVFRYMNNASRIWLTPWPPYTRILVLESGLFDDPQNPIPAKIVGLTDVSQLDTLFKTAKGRDEYLRDAALLSLRELANEQDFPAQQKVRDWLKLEDSPKARERTTSSTYTRRQAFARAFAPLTATLKVASDRNAKKAGLSLPSPEPSRPAEPLPPKAQGAKDEAAGSAGRADAKGSQRAMEEAIAVAIAFVQAQRIIEDRDRALLQKVREALENAEYLCAIVVDAGCQDEEGLASDMMAHWGFDEVCVVGSKDEADQKRAELQAAHSNVKVKIVEIINKGSDKGCKFTIDGSLPFETEPGIGIDDAIRIYLESV